MTLQDWERNAGKRPVWTLVKGASVILLIGAVFAAGIGLITTGSIFFKGERDKLVNPAREKSVLFDPNNSIGRYEDFYDKCRSVVALDQKIVLAEREVADRTKTYDPKLDDFGEERKALARLRDSLRALRNLQIDTAQSYNADSSKTTRAQFKGADLPYTLDPPYSEIDCGTAKSAGR